jgi:hypothetical protein
MADEELGTEPEEKPPEEDDGELIVDLPGEEDDDEDKEAEPEKPEKAEPEKQPPEDLDNLKAELERAKKDRDKAFYELRKATKTAEKREESPKFTDAQIVELLSTHKDDPAVLFQIMKQVSSQEGAAKAKVAVEDQEVQTIRKTADDFISNNFPSYLKEDSEDRHKLAKAKGILRVEDHPLGDFLGVAGIALMQLPNIIENIKKQAAEDAAKAHTEQARKKAIKETSPASSKPKTKGSTTSDIDSNAREVIEKLGLTGAAAKTYVKMLRNARNTSVMMTE